ncbi:hypothetical protein V6N12_047509 [Hibiscus sabdariffa]|uniref:RNase H type-1 domain-containing protein n=1 Tax=Hibiscus sabdariffa TaxID=183260 RepID=A0ABR2DB46_9ROSI
MQSLVYYFANALEARGEARDKSHPLVVESDSLEALRSIKAGRNGQLASGLVLHILELCGRRWDVSFSHIKCGGNKAVDCMAKLAIFDGLETSFFQDPPQAVVPLLQADVGHLVSSRNHEGLGSFCCHFHFFHCDL